MERIKLTKQEKQVLRYLHGLGYCPKTYPRHVFAGCVYSLERKKLVKGAYTEGHELEAAALTSKGKHYMASNPDLRNPIDWWWVLAGVAFIIVLIEIFIMAVCVIK